MVRSVEVPNFSIVDGIVHYNVAVNAIEGRHWTVVKRYSDFKVLEQNTWQQRGPMPPFPYAWEGFQIMLHLAEPVIQRKRRLEVGAYRGAPAAGAHPNLCRATAVGPQL